MISKHFAKLQACCMTLINSALLMVLLALPASGWCAQLKYGLSVVIHPVDGTLSGYARLASDVDLPIRLSVFDLQKLKINGTDAKPEGDKTVSLTIKKGQEVAVSYEALLSADRTNIVEPTSVFLLDRWYPQPDVLAQYTLSAELPKPFIAISESDAVTVRNQERTKTYHFQFDHPLNALHLAASTRYVPRKSVYDNIAIEAYFFEEDVHLADIYISYAKKYLQTYETMLTPYPFRRFAMVENILPTGISMPTFTLLGQQVVRLPFIVKTSLGHEILHQWFGNSVYIDNAHGNWAEGITTYLSDHYYADLKGEGAAYRKQIMIDYHSYVNDENVISVSDFMTGQDKARRAVGYGKTAMLFHELRERCGDKEFFSALRQFVVQNSFRSASWHDIQRAFEKATGDNLYQYFGDRLARKDIPHIAVESSSVKVEKGQLKLNLLLVQKCNPYTLRIPVTWYDGKVKKQHVVTVDDKENRIAFTLDSLPDKVVIDEDYTFMRQLSQAEIPPVLSSIMGKNRLLVVVAPEKRGSYQPLIDALAPHHATVVSAAGVTFAQLQEHSFLIADYRNPLVQRLFGGRKVPTAGVRLEVLKNPYNAEQRMLLLNVKNGTEAKAVQQTITHYGKYSELAFDNGKNTFKSTAASDNGILALSRPSVRVLEPDKTDKLSHIMPALMSSRIIYIGERHDNFAHHINQLTIIKNIHESGTKVAVGMEMFQRPYQDVVNDYIAGHIGEAAFLRKTEYYSTWKYDYNLYKPIVDYLKQHKIPLLALNITGDITRQVAREGMQSISKAQEKQTPAAMNFADEQYRKDLRQVYVAHDKQEALQNFNYFWQAQTLWDESMAETAYQFLSNNSDYKLVILAGNGHLRYKYGIPARLYRRNHEPYQVVVQDEEIENNIADYILLSSELKGEQSPRLGIIVEENDQGLVIRSVDSAGPAKKAGLKKDDIIQQLDSQPIATLADLKLALFFSEYGTTLKIEVNRKGKSLTKSVELFQFDTMADFHLKKK
jgi:uncharacterized iron-regulated protein